MAGQARQDANERFNFFKANYTNCIYFLVQLKNKYAMVNADTT